MLISRTTSAQSSYKEPLPVEITSNIFKWAHVNATSNDGPPIFSKKHPSVVLSCVCREWREIALSTPELWTDLHIVFPRGFIELCEHYSTGEMHLKDNDSRVEAELECLGRKLAVWLDRSRYHPLTVTGMSVKGLELKYTRIVPQGESKESLAILLAFDRIRALIRSSLSRWSRIELLTNAQRRIQVSHDTGNILNFLHWTYSAQDIGAFLSKLRSARIAVPPAYSDEHDIFSKLAFHQWGALQDLALFDAHRRQWDEILKLLQSCPNLVTLELHRRPVACLPYQGWMRVVLPRLRSITFGGIPPDLGLHEAFNLPVLRSFTVSASFWRAGVGNWQLHNVRDWWYRESLTKWMERFGFGLTTLNLISNGDRVPTETWLVGCLMSNLVPNITHLRSVGRMDPNILLEILAYGLPSGEPCCPRLQEFVSVYYSGHIVTLSEEATLDFITARLATADTRSAHRLRHVEIELEDGGELDLTLELMERGVDLKGVTIRLTYPCWREGERATKVVTIHSGTPVNSRLRTKVTMASAALGIVHI